MFKIDNNLNISLDKGDTGNIYIKVKEHKFLTGDKICIAIYSDTAAIYKEDVTSFEEGIGYIKFTEQKTNALPVGKYKYSVKITIPSLNYASTLIKDKDFIIERSFNC